MKNQFIITLLSLSLIGMIATAQTKKPTTTKKPSTAVISTAPKTTTKTSTTTTTTIPKSTTAPVVVEEKKTTTTTTSSSPSNSMNSTGSSSSTTIQQSTGPSKRGRKPVEPKPEKAVEPKPERAAKVREPKPEKMKKSSSSSDGTGVHFGIKAGANNLFFLGGNKVGDGSFAATPAFAVGFHGGLVANIGISELFAIQPEVLYVQQNAKFAEGSDNLTIDGSAIEVPIALQFNFGGGPTKFFLNLGGYGSYALAGGVSGTVGGTTIPKTAFDYTGISFSDRTDYGAIAGIGLKFNQALFIEARGNYSLKDGTFKDSAGKKVVPIFAGLSLGYFF